MNSNLGSSPSSSNSSDDEDREVVKRIQERLIHDISNNNMYLQVLQQNHHRTIGGSIPGHIVINPDREVAHHRMYNDYFSNDPLYDDAMFRRRYRMSRSLFIRIVDAVKDHDHYFQQRVDRSGKLGLSPIQKISVVFWMLAYDSPTDVTDEYIKIGESTSIESMNRFCRAIKEVFTEQYFRAPGAHDISRLLHVGKQRGFPGMLGSLDCMHWKWKKYPTAWVGQYAGRSGRPTIILKAVTDYDLWI